MKGKIMADELIDIYDENMNHLGTAMKSQAHREGLWHRAFHCWIVSGDKVWLQLRGKNKTLYPDLFDISAAGHLGAGEEAKTAGLREIKEELGLSAREDQLIKLFTYRLVEDTPDMKVREFCPTYLWEADKKLSDIEMQSEEVDGVFEAAVKDVVKLFEHKTESIKINGLARQEKGGSLPEIRNISIDSFVPHGESYYLKVMSALDRYISGRINGAA